MAVNTSYSEKLKDPRWQKMRLEVFQRDEWLCQRCFTDNKSLQVHHAYYVSGREPWEYPLDSFETLCDECHKTQRAISSEGPDNWEYGAGPLIQFKGCAFDVNIEHEVAWITAFSGLSEREALLAVVNATMNGAITKENFKEWLTKY